MPAGFYVRTEERALYCMGCDAITRRTSSMAATKERVGHDTHENGFYSWKCDGIIFQTNQPRKIWINRSIILLHRRPGFFTFLRKTARTRMDLLDCCSPGNQVGDDTEDSRAMLSTFEVDPLTVDYITSTPLFDNIVRQDWDAVNFFLESGTFSFSPFQSDDESTNQPAAAEDQVETWVVCQNDEGKLIWRKLPIHAALCYGAPYKTVQELVRTYPAGLCCADTDGNLPLHLAVKFNHPENVLRLLLKEFPGAFHAENGKGQTPLQCAEDIEDREGKERFERLRAFQEAESYLANKQCRELQTELESLEVQIEVASEQLTKAQRELWYLKRFPIRVISRRDRLFSPWKRISKRRLPSE